LWDAIEAFNKAQTSGSYDEDRTRRARVAHLRDPEELSRAQSEDASRKKGE
jgi:hypothetical protein